MHVLDDITGAVVDAAMKIHQDLGAGLLSCVGPLLTGGCRRGLRAGTPGPPARRGGVTPAAKIHANGSNRRRVKPEPKWEVELLVAILALEVVSGAAEQLRARLIRWQQLVEMLRNEGRSHVAAREHRVRRRSMQEAGVRLHRPDRHAFQLVR